jgi:hypothetical protein
VGSGALYRNGCAREFAQLAVVEDGRVRDEGGVQSGIPRFWLDDSRDAWCAHSLISRIMNHR